MATTTQKFSKDNTKPRAPVSRLTPRPTAASAARAARIANNRNSDPTNPIRTSPTRASHSPSAKAKAPIAQFDTKEDLKNETRNVSSNEELMVPDKNDQGNQEQLQDDHGECDITKDPSEDNCQELDVFESSKEQQLPDEDPKKQIEELGDEKRDTSDGRDSTTGSKTPDKQSRPNTPASRSRPTTPKYSSRPHTPKLPSRPTTPAHSVQKNSNSSSRPVTPQRQSLVHRGRSSSIPVPSRAQTPSSTGDRSQISVKTNEDDIKAVFTSKQKQFHEMKKELDLKQQSVLELLDNLQNLSKRMLQEGITDTTELSELSNFVIFNVADWTTEELAQLCHKVTSSNVEGAVELINSIETYGENTVSELNTKIMDVPARFAELCIQAFTARQEIIDWLKVILKTNELGSGEAVDRIARYNSQGLEFCEALRELKSLADNIVDTVTQFLSRAFRERCALLSVGKSLVNEITQLREEVNKNSVAVSNLQDSLKEVPDSTESPDLRRELEEERSAKTNLKDKLSTSESQLRQARVRITKMDRQLREAEASIAALTSTVKSLEDQSRQKEVQLEARARKLRESLKTGELNSNHIAQARDVLQTQVQELQQQISNMTEQHKTAIHELNRHLKEAKASLEEYKVKAQNQEEQNQLNQEEIYNTKNLIEELNTKITQYEKCRNSDLPTEREMDLWAELQATKETLRMTEDEVSACKKEKINFLESLNKISESDRAGTQQKLAAELMSKEEIINKMQGQFRELSKNLRLNEKKVAQYEQYVRDLQEHMRIITGNTESNQDQPTYEELQQEIMSLRMGLLDSVHKNEQLTELIGQKDQQLDQQDKTSRAQSRVIKVREELINMLKSKECEQSRELTALQQNIEHRMKIVDEVNQQIAAKADEIQDLFATLESKQQQIHRLEKIVLALEEQQKRAQAQRTRQEEKIAALEHELAAGGNRRERKFLFF